MLFQLFCLSFLNDRFKFVLSNHKEYWKQEEFSFNFSVDRLPLPAVSRGKREETVYVSSHEVVLFVYATIWAQTKSELSCDVLANL